MLFSFVHEEHIKILRFLFCFCAVDHIKISGFLSRSFFPSPEQTAQPCEETRDLLTPVTVQVLDRPDPDSVQLRQAKRDWATAAAEWCKAQTGKAAAEKAKPQQLYRKKAYEWLLASNHALETMFAQGWRSFQIPEDCSMSPESWPCITCALDQGSDGFCAVHFLEHVRVNILVVNDASHRVWNDAQLALKDSGCWSLCMIGLVLLNLDHGPWEGARWHSESQQAALEYNRLANAECPLFLQHLPRICLETGRRLQDANPEMAAEIWESLPDAVQKKLPHVGFSRWFAFFDSMDVLTKLWSQRLLFYEYICLQLGTPVGSKKEKVVVALERRNEDEDVRKSTTKNDQAEVRKARSACKNTLEFAALVMQDRCFWMICRGLCSLSAFVRDWHGEQNKRNRSCQESVSWMLGMASGEGADSCRETLKQLQSEAFLEELGMPTAALPAGVGSLDAGHPLVVEEREVVGKLADYAWSLCKRRLRSLGWHSETYPGMFALLLSKDEGLSKYALATMKDDWDCWERLRVEKGPFWKKLQERSPFRCIHTQQIFKLLRASAWEASEVVRDVVEKHFAAITQTKVVEDSVRLARVAETNKGMSKKIGPATVWQELSSSELGSKTHRFTAPAWQAEVVPTGLNTSSSSGLFHPVPRETWEELRKVVSARRTAPWYSPSPLASLAPAEDLALLRHCKQQDCWAAAKNSWCSLLVDVPRLCLRPRGRDDSDWFYSLGSVGGSAVAAWPMEIFVVGSVTFLSPKPEGCKFWLHLLRAEDWEALTVQWCGPLEQKARASCFPSDRFIVAKGNHEALPLLQCAARSAFWSLPKTTLLSVARHLGAAASSDLPLAGVLEVTCLGLACFG